MGFAQQLEKLSTQPLEEQNLLLKSYNNLKDYLFDKKVDSFMKEVDLKGPSALQGSPYENDRKVILKVIDKEAQFIQDKNRRVQVGDIHWETNFDFETNQSKPTNTKEEDLLTKDERARLKSYGSDRKPSSVLRYVSDAMQEDITVCMKAATLIGGQETKFMGSAPLDNFEIGKECLIKYQSEVHNGYPCTLEPFSKRLKDDKEFVMYAVDQDGKNLEFASDRLKDDAQVAWESLHDYEEDGMAFISERLKKDTELAQAAIKWTGCKLEHFSDEIKADKQMVILACKSYDETQQHQFALVHASKEIQQIVGNGNPVQILTKAIAQEKFSHSLDRKLVPKAEAPTRKLKI